MLHSRLFPLICVFSNVAIANNIKSLSPYPKAKWTVAVYMNGDNELEPSITGGEVNLSPASQSRSRARTTTYTAPGDFHTELAALGSNDDVHVVALVDRSPGYASNMDNWNNSRLYYVNKGNLL